MVHVLCVVVTGVRLGFWWGFLSVVLWLGVLECSRFPLGGLVLLAMRYIAELSVTDVDLFGSVSSRRWSLANTSSLRESECHRQCFFFPGRID